MNREQHLDRILAKLDSLIAGAKLRTPGRWEAENQIVWHHDAERESSSICCTDSHRLYEDATFIASCAGNAEAGWVATRAAIVGLRNIGWYELDGEIHMDNSHNGRVAVQTLDSIIAAWPEEVL